ncbi:MAG TPA: T9SS type A sorting domain-containing protein [Ignavibacteria bacterium]|nr:T9SS type A sorting domain-containing protein [Ignavibacteria bacterium]
MKKKTFLFAAASLLIVILVSGYELMSGNTPTTLDEAGYTKVNYTTSLPQMDGGSWTSAPSIPAGPRYYGASATYTRNDTTWLFITGGDTTGSGHPTRTGMKYNYRTNQWSYIAPMPVPLRNHSAAIVGDVMFVYGGLNSPTSNGTNKIYKYQIDLNVWSSGGDLQDTLFLQGSIGINDTCALIVGGVSPTPTLDGGFGEVFEVAIMFSDFIANLPLLPFALANPQLFLDNTSRGGSTVTVYIIGGIKAGGFLSPDVIEAEIDLANPSNSTYTVHSNVIPGGGLARHEVVGLPNGTAIVSGGSRTLNFDAINNHYLFTPPSTFTPLPGSTIPLCAHYSGVGFDGNNYKLLISGGITSGQSLNSTSMIYSDTLTSSISQISNNIPDRISLHQNYPNPFNPSTKIRFDITSGSLSDAVKLAVYDITGREVAVLVNQQLSAGSYEYTFNAKGLTSGIYFFRLDAGDFSDVRKMTLLK